MSKFQTLNSFENAIGSNYQLLPFRFTRFENEDYILTNQVGEYVLLDRIELYAFAQHRLEVNSEVYNTLKAKHFLMDDVSSVAPDLLALKLRTKLHRLADFTGLHIFVTTLRCEHSCPYCQVSRQSDDKHSFDMTEETADKALDMVFKSPSPAIKIEFQGGESLLNFQLIRYIVQQANYLNQTFQRDIQFVIATNLSVVTDEMLKFCEEFHIHMSTSLDGPADLHNKNRPRPGQDSHERAIKGIKMVRDHLGQDQVSALMTTTEASLGRVKEIIDEYVKVDFHGIFLRPLSPYGFAIKTKSYQSYEYDEWLDFYFDGLEYILEINKAGYYFSEYYASLILTKMLTPFPTGFVDLMSPAGTVLGAIVYNYDGEVYASDESRMLAEMGDKTFKLGNLHQHTYEEIIMSDALLSPLEESYSGSAPMCSDCAFEPFCGSEPVFHHATQGDFVGHKPTSSFCNRNMAIFKHLIKLLNRDAETNRILRSWIRV